MTVPILDLISTLGFFIALIYILRIHNTMLDSYIKALFCFAMGLYVFVGLSNVLEHGTITVYFDRFEDYAEILFFPFILFALHIAKTESEIKRRMLAEETLLESEATIITRQEQLLKETKFTDTVIKTMTGIFYVYDENQRLIRWNKNHETLTGYSTDELRQRKAFDWFEGEDKERAAQWLQQLLNEGEKTLEANMVMKDGTVVPYLLSARRFEVDEKNYFAGIGLDLSILKKAEKELSRLVTAIEQADEIIVITDTEGRIEYVNPAFQVATGYSREEAVGQKMSMLNSGKVNEQVYQELWATLGQGLVWKGHFVNKRKDGRIYEEEATISPVKNDADEIVNFVAVKRDVTRELRMQEQLRQSQKMESIGTLAGGIAHDFNNMLAAIMGYTELSLDDVKDRPETHESLKQVLHACDRAKDLVRQILIFSRTTTINRTPIPTIPIINEVCKFLRSSLPTTIEIKQKINITCGWIMADATQFHQILMNLCTNAGHAMQKTGGELHVIVDEVILNENDLMTSPDLKPGSYLQLTVKDTGYGISQENLERIFEPYFTTKEQEGGTGLGLAVVHGIVKDYGGEIKVYSEPGKGTVFNVLFPLIEQVAETDHVEKLESLPTGTESILFVDDEEPLVNVGKAILERLGYTVKGLTQADEALEVFLNAKDTFDLVITDKTMPKLTGFDLAVEIKKVRPDIPILLCTGFQDKNIDAKIQEAGIAGYIMKPINMRKMAENVREVLDK
jgi:PAS domain S-box-containing protein